MQKKLYKSRTDKVLDGVCGGLAHYFQVDAVIIRILWVVGSIFLGAGFLGVFAYIIAMLVIPVEPYYGKKGFRQSERNHNMNSDADDEENDFLFEPKNSPKTSENNNNESPNPSTNSSYEDSPYHGNDHPDEKNRFSLALGYILVCLGIYLILEKLFHFQLHRWFREFQPYIWPSLLILLGIFLLTRRTR